MRICVNQKSNFAYFSEKYQKIKEKHRWSITQLAQFYAQAPVSCNEEKPKVLNKPLPNVWLYMNLQQYLVHCQQHRPVSDVAQPVPGSDLHIQFVHKRAQYSL